MGWESVGSVDTGQIPGDLFWIDFCQELAIRYIRFVCGDPPPGSTLGVMQNDHELGTYPSIGIWSDFSPEFDYINSCEKALDIFNEAIDWETLKDHFEDAQDEEIDKEGSDDDENIEDAHRLKPKI